MHPVVNVSTGLSGLDRILDNLHLGDNVVWKIDHIGDYRDFVAPYVERSLQDERRLIYMRFADHPPVVNMDDERIVTYTLNAWSGFESFAHEVYAIIEKEGVEAFYVFDCLSDLLSAWATDMMIGNFFIITCPHLYELNTIAYFAIKRSSHDFKTIARIRETTQLLIDIYNFQGTYYVHPIKVENRYSPTMFFPHKKEDDAFIPIMNNVDASDFISYLQKATAEMTKRNLDFWDRLFLEVETLNQKEHGPEEAAEMINRLFRLMVGKEERMRMLVEKNFTIGDFLTINDRLIGTGFIGGKSAGMLIARKILDNDTDRSWAHIMEPHDSFYVGSDVFYTFIVQNGLWNLFMKYKTKEGCYEAAAELREKMLTGSFPEVIKEQYLQIIEYFGQSPFIVRSSSLLEDAYGHAFAGKYESYFCINQGTPQDRYREFTRAIRMVYASMMSEDALAYRIQRGLDELDEQMALLIQRVSGSRHNRYFFPDIGGVGLSYNTYVWKKGMDPDAGMIRIVFGLGTRAVDRVEGDYPRIVALDAPLTQPLSGMADERRFSQHEVDLLDIETNSFKTLPLGKLLAELPELSMDKIGEIDLEAQRKIREMNLKDVTAWLINFRSLLGETNFPEVMKVLMNTIEAGYQYPVDIEFTVNFTAEGDYRINLLQCRPYQSKGLKLNVPVPEKLESKRIFFESEGYFLGGSVFQPVKRIIIVEADDYFALSASGKYDVARMVGRLNRLIDDRESMPTMLIGPGRWGTTTPSLGIPVSFSEINRFRYLVELAVMSRDVMPELSFGTHFFQDLVETEIFYIALFPEREGVFYDENFPASHLKRVRGLVADSGSLDDIVKVYDVVDESMNIVADIISQKLICYCKK